MYYDFFGLALIRFADGVESWTWSADLLERDPSVVLEAAPEPRVQEVLVSECKCSDPGRRSRATNYVASF